MADYQQNFMDALQGGLQFGQQIKGIQDQRQIGQLAGQAYGAPRDQRQSLLGQLAQISPQAASAQRKQWSADDEMDQEELVNMARFIKAAPPEQQAAAYSSILPKLRERGMQAPEWTPETQQTILQTVDALVSAYGGEDANNPYAGLPSDIQSLKMLSENPELAALDRERRQASGMVPKLVQTAQGYGWGTPGAGIDLAPLGGVAGSHQAPQRQSTQVEDDQVASRLNAYRDQLIQAGLQGPQLDAALVAAEQQLWRGDTQAAQQQPAAIAQPFRKPAAAPAGYSVNPDGTMAAIPGGPADIAIQARQDAAAARKAAEDVKATQKRQEADARQLEATAATDQLISAIDTLTSSPGFPELGTEFGDLKIATPLIRSDVKDANAQLKNIGGQVALSTMARLKALSSSGATGFGALSAPELKLLENAIATLQSDDISNTQLRASLKTIKDTLEKTKQWKPPKEDGYQMGQIIEANGKRYRVTGLGDPSDPDVEEVP